MSNIFIVELCGGLGNQIYQYSLFLLLKQKGYKCYLNADDFYLHEFGGNSLVKVFPLSMQYITANRYIRYISFIYRKITRLRFVLESKFPLLYGFFNFILPYRIIVFPKWNNYYFLDEINNKECYYNFPDLDEKNKKLYQDMLKNNSVSIHVRRGDFQSKKKWRISLGDICDLDYYCKSIEVAKEIIDSPVFYVFSDDISWVQDNLKLRNVKYVDCNHGSDSYKDMQLMTACKVNICANSTFSLIGAWLNVNNDSVRIVPSKWVNSIPDILFKRYVPVNSSRWYLVDNCKPQVSIIPSFELSTIAINNIIDQSYTDFEVLSTCFPLATQDSRFLDSKNARGNFIYKVDDAILFENHNHLREWVMNQYVDCVE